MSVLLVDGFAQAQAAAAASASSLFVGRVVESVMVET